MQNKKGFIPNSITLSRIGLSVIFAVNAAGQFAYGNNSFWNLVAVFLTICLTDFLDGRIARRLHCASVTGAKLDILADLFFIVVSNITLIRLGILPLWFFVFILLKFLEFIITSNITIRSGYSFTENVFIFDKIGRIVSATFFVVPGAACIFQVLTPSLKEILIGFMMYFILAGGILSSYIRITSCLKLNKIQ